MNSNPFFSIIIPTYNRKHFIQKTIDSLLAQTYTNFEIIIVDDGSTDDTESLIKNMNDKRIHYSKKSNGERGAARNFGVSLAQGQYINFFDSDDVSLSSHLETAFKMIEVLENPAWFHLGYAWADTSGNIIKKVNNFSGKTLNNLMYNGNPLSCNSVFVRKDIISKIQFNENRELSGSEDYELWCRLASRYPLYYSNEITSLVIDHEARTIRVFDCKKLIKQLNLLIHYLEQDDVTLTYFGRKFNLIRMHINAYIAVHLASHKKYKLDSIKYLLKAIYNSYKFLSNRCFYATVKNLIFKW